MRKPTDLLVACAVYPPTAILSAAVNAARATVVFVRIRNLGFQGMMDPNLVSKCLNDYLGFQLLKIVGLMKDTWEILGGIPGVKKPSVPAVGLDG